MYYHLQSVTPQLCFITWRNAAWNHARPQTTFVDELTKLLNAATQPLYFLSDLRQGHLMMVREVRRLAELAKHPQYGGGVAYSDRVVAEVMVESFAAFAGQSNLFFHRLEEALARLEQMQPGVTAGVDWQAALEKAAAD